MTLLGVPLKLTRQTFKFMLQLQVLLGLFLAALFFMDLLKPSLYDASIMALVFGPYAHAVGLSPLNGFRHAIVFLLISLCFALSISLLRYIF